jgi:hypothetical protein
MKISTAYLRLITVLVVIVWLRAAPAHADVTSLGLGHAEVFVGLDLVNDAKSNQGAAASDEQLIWGGIDVTYSALGILLKQHGSLRFGDLFAVSVAGGQKRTSGNAVAAALFDARAGAQLLYASSPAVDIGLEAGACSCHQFDEFAGGTVREIVPFGGARFRWQRLSIGAGWMRGPYAAVGWDVGVGRLGVQVVRPSLQTRYPQNGSGDFFDVSATLIRLSLGRDF